MARRIPSERVLWGILSRIEDMQKRREFFFSVQPFLKFRATWPTEIELHGENQQPENAVR